METGRSCRARWRIAVAAHNLCVLIGQIACQSSSLLTVNWAVCFFHRPGNPVPGSVCLHWVVSPSVCCKYRYWIWVTFKRCKLIVKKQTKKNRYTQKIGIEHQDLQCQCGFRKIKVHMRYHSWCAIYACQKLLMFGIINGCDCGFECNPPPPPPKKKSQKSGLFFVF